MTKIQLLLCAKLQRETLTADAIRESAIEALQSQNEVDEPEEDSMPLLMEKESVDVPEDDMSEEKMLRALMEAQSAS